MTKHTLLRISERHLICGAIIGLLVLSNPALSQTSSTSGGPEFLKAGERNGVFKSAPNRKKCEVVSHNLSFCAAGTDWLLERDPVPGKQALYQLSEGRRASLTVVPMEENVSRNLGSDEVVELLNRHIFADGPRGRMDVEAVVEDETTLGGRLQHRRAFVRDDLGRSYVLQVTISPMDYGLGFLETTIAVPTAGEKLTISEEDVAFHEEFLNRARVSISIHR